MGKETEADESRRNGAGGFANLAADDSGARPPLWQSAGKFLLWLLLLAWLGALFNYRVGNPLSLPTFGLAERIDATGRSRAAAPEANPAEAAVAPAPQEETAAVEAAVEQAGAEAAASAEKFAEEAGRANVPPSEWGPGLLEKLAAGDPDGAARAAKGADSDLGDEVAAFVKDIRDVDYYVTKFIMARKGQETEITFNGKKRTIVPVSSIETTVSAKFGDRSISIDVAKFADDEKMRWLDNADDAKSHAAAAAFAMKVGSCDAVGLHLREAGPLSKLAMP